tara:strand:- start:14 stop:772 length:759 start_codon:yes stop_codon:yes gene_type:complete
MDLMLGYVSWKSPRNIEKILKSHKEHGLHNISSQIIIFFNEVSDIDISIAKKYGCDYVPSTNNKGLGKALLHLLKMCTCKYFCFIECDWSMNPETLDIFLDGIKLLENNVVDYVYLRDARNPGEPLCGKNQTEKAIKEGHGLQPILWGANPIHNAKWIKTDINEWAICDSIYQQWSNNPFVISTKCMSFLICFLDNINMNTVEEEISHELQNNPTHNFIMCYGKKGVFRHSRIKSEHPKWKRCAWKPGMYES